MLLLDLKDVSKMYGDFMAVDHVNLSLFEGETVGLLGPNGAGKSTTISMIATLFKPSQGQVTYRGQDIVKKPDIIQGDLGYVPQDIALYEQLSGYENLYYFGKLYGLKGSELKERIEEVSKIIGIDEKLKYKVKTYSGGMKRRINIGVALMHRPKFIIMDEPTVGIDPQSRNHILETVKALNETGITVLYTSHYMEEVSQLCKRIYIMDHGRVIAEGQKDELIEQARLKETIKVVFEPGLCPSIDTLKQLNFVSDCRLDDEDTLLVECQEEANKCLGQLVSAFGGILSFDVIKPDLEQVFLKLTGRGLRD